MGGDVDLAAGGGRAAAQRQDVAADEFFGAVDPGMIENSAEVGMGDEDAWLTGRAGVQPQISTRPSNGGAATRADRAADGSADRGADGGADGDYGAPAAAVLAEVAGGDLLEADEELACW